MELLQNVCPSVTLVFSQTVNLEKSNRPENHEKSMQIDVPQWPYIAAEDGNDFMGGK